VSSLVLFDTYAQQKLCFTLIKGTIEPPPSDMPSGKSNYSRSRSRPSVFEERFLLL
jgi:hypothetical protein